MDLPSSSGSPSLPQLVLTLFGLYAREEENWLSIGAIVGLMGDIGFERQLVRSAVSRLKGRGLLCSDRRGGAAGYALTATALEVLREGDARIFESVRGTVESGWVLAVFSVPDAERDKRDALRKVLSRLGFGVTAPGVWIAPAHLFPETESLLTNRELIGFVDLFQSTYRSPRDLRTEVARWWDLTELAALYEEFLARYRPMSQQGLRGLEAFRLYLTLVTEWRRLPYRDPGIPLAVLPEDWKGQQAAELFRDLAHALQPAAESHVRYAIRGNAVVES